MTVASTAAPRNARAAKSPPNPEPMMTTRCLAIPLVHHDEQATYLLRLRPRLRLGAGGGGAMAPALYRGALGGQRQVGRRVDERHVREGLREVAEHAPRP